MAVNGTKSHGYMPVQNGEHKGQGKYNGSRKGNDAFDVKELAKKKVGPGKNQQKRNRKRPVDEGNSLIVTFA